MRTVCMKCGVVSGTDRQFDMVGLAAIKKQSKRQAYLINSRREVIAYIEDILIESLKSENPEITLTETERFRQGFRAGIRQFPNYEIMVSKLVERLEKEAPVETNPKEEVSKSTGEQK